jgi:UDP-N-acetylglucosamine--dolichyl-phosphate N-acetylglucosaminephosphotransferase
MNKSQGKLVAGSGGIVVVTSFIISTLIFIAYRVFIIGSSQYIIEIFAILLVCAILAGIGIVDDILGWQRGGLSIRSRLVLAAIAAIPLMVINVGKQTLELPFFGVINLGIIYPLFFIPLGLVGAATTYNFLAGFNALEAGQGIILLSALSLVSLFTGNSWLGAVLICMVFSLLAFLIFNFYPARVFPGNSITLVLGGLIAIACIVGNFEKIAVFFFIPYILETILKLRGGLVKQSFGQPNKYGGLDLKYDKIYGLTHVSIYLLKKIGIAPTEKRTVYLIWIFQIIIILFGFILFRKGLFI